MDEPYDWDSYLAAALHVTPESVPSWKATIDFTEDGSGKTVVRVGFPMGAPDLEWEMTDAIEEDGEYVFVDEKGDCALLDIPQDFE